MSSTNSWQSLYHFIGFIWWIVSYLHLLSGISGHDLSWGLYVSVSTSQINTYVYVMKQTSWQGDKWCEIYVLLFTYFNTFGPQYINALRPGQNDHHFADDTFYRIFVNENARIFNKFSLKFVPKGPINNIPALVQIMAWRRPGDKPLSEPVMVSLLTHICVTWPQWVNRHKMPFKCLLVGVIYCAS